MRAGEVLGDAAVVGHAQIDVGFGLGHGAGQGLQAAAETGHMTGTGQGGMRAGGDGRLGATMMAGRNLAGDGMQLGGAGQQTGGAGDQNLLHGQGPPKESLNENDLPYDLSSLG